MWDRLLSDSSCAPAGAPDAGSRGFNSILTRSVTIGVHVNVPQAHRWLHRYAIALAVCTLFLVVAGASVTSKQAGLSVPDWPLSYGQVMPQMTGGVLFEHGHRMVATFVGLLTIGLVICLSRAEKRAWMRRLGWVALGAVIVQGLLGGLTVLLLLPPPVSVAHACLAQLFFSTTVAIAMFTSRSWQSGAEMVEDYGKPSLRSLAVVIARTGAGADRIGRSLPAWRHERAAAHPRCDGGCDGGPDSSAPSCCTSFRSIAPFGPRR